MKAIKKSVNNKIRQINTDTISDRQKNSKLNMPPIISNMINCGFCINALSPTRDIKFAVHVSLSVCLRNYLTDLAEILHSDGCLPRTLHLAFGGNRPIPSAESGAENVVFSG